MNLPAISFQTPAINLGWPGYYQGNVDYLRLVAIKGESEKIGTRTDLQLRAVRWGRACGSMGDSPLIWPIVIVTKYTRWRGPNIDVALYLWG